MATISINVLQLTFNQRIWISTEVTLVFATQMHLLFPLILEYISLCFNRFCVFKQLGFTIHNAEFATSVIENISCLPLRKYTNKACSLFRFFSDKLSVISMYFYFKKRYLFCTIHPNGETVSLSHIVILKILTKYKGHVTLCIIIT